MASVAGVSEPAEGSAEQVQLPPTIYCSDGLHRELRQGEIITGFTQYRYDFEANAAAPIPLPFVIVASQDCDLLQDYNRVMSEGKPSSLNGILLVEARVAADNLKGLGGSDIWKRVRQNKDERWHLLEAVPAGNDVAKAGIPALLVDLKQVLAVHRNDLYRQIELGQAARRCRLETPYREHFQFRFAQYISRVGLPEPHKWE